MDVTKLLTAGAELAVFFKRLWVKSEKQSYEQNRHKTEASAADEFERQFNPNGLHVDGQLPGDKTSNGEGG